MTRSSFKLDTNALYDLGLILLVATGNLFLVARSSLTLTAVALLGVAFAARIFQLRGAMLRVPFQAPLWLFTLTAIFSVTASYDAEASWQKVWLIVGGVILFYIVATLKTEWVRLLVVAGLLAFTSGTALYFLTQNNFSTGSAKLDLVNQIGVQLNRLSPQLGLHSPHPNLIAGILLLGLPFAVAWGYNALRVRAWRIAVPVGLVTALHVFALFMTTSRGAGLALGLVLLLALWFGSAVYLARRARLAENVAIAGALNVLLLGIVLVFIVGGSRVLPALFDAMGTAGGVPRLELYRLGAQLAEAVPFTGIGVNTFDLNYSTYVLLIDVLFLPHAHNVYLQVWIEQGVVGLFAFVWLLGAYYFWAWRYRKIFNWLAWAGVFAVSMMLLHGLLDVTFYFSRVLPLMFLPFALPITAVRKKRHAVAPIPRRTWLTALGLSALAAAILAGIALLHLETLGAWWNANQGAVTQAQIELPEYHFSDRTVRVLRRKLDYAPAVLDFEKALGRDPHNVTALSRLGILSLDQRDYVQAAGYLEAAIQVAPQNRAVIKALGYTYTWLGKIDSAVTLLKNIPEAAIELKTAASEIKQTQPNLADYANTVIERLKHQGKP